LLSSKDFKNRFKETPNLKLTLIITGPIAAGHFEYFQDLIKNFKQILNTISDEVKEKIFIAFLFSELDKKIFKEKFNNPVEIPDLYNISSLILLPSKTEGRGLPIIEAAACGVPIFCSKYYPENVYSEVIGKHLAYKDRLKVIEFDGKNITLKHLKRITERVFYPHKFSEEVKHNNRVVQNRYSYDSLENDIDNVLCRLFTSIKYNKKYDNIVKSKIKEFNNLFNSNISELDCILKTKNREYLPGYGRLRFMILLKSLIDPSYFRIEEQLIKGIAFSFAYKLLKKHNLENINSKRIIKFYNIIEHLFSYKNKEIDIRHDHSLAYRHRNKINYPYQDYTIQELTGIINLIFHKVLKPKRISKEITSRYFFTDWNLALLQLTSASYLGIDDRDILIKKLQANIPIAFFPNKYFKNELEFFALQSVRSRLNLSIDTELTDEILKNNTIKVEPIYIIVNKILNIEGYSYSEIKNYLLSDIDKESKLLYKYGIIKLIESKQPTVGIHFKLLGYEALEVLKYVKEKKGIIISTRKDSSVMTDIVDIDRVHIGKANNEFIANILGIELNTGFIQFVPAGLRSTLAYPTPVQTAKELSQFLKSDDFEKAVKKYGKEKVFNFLKNDAETKMSPVRDVIKNIDKNNQKTSDIEYSNISGVYEDNMPWSGNIAKAIINKNSEKLKFIINSSKKTKTVTKFVDEFEEKTNKKSAIAWNGGYILNAELVGKLGLPESYIGSPLGLLVSSGKVLSAPLYNKPAIVVYESGDVDILRVNCSKGINVSRGTLAIHLPQDQYNMANPGDKIAYYNLLSPSDKIKGNGRVIVKLAGNVIKEIIKTKKQEDVKLTPVGLTISFPADKFPKEFDEIGKELNLEIIGLENIKQAVEAGPLLINNSNYCLDMKIEGWKTLNSIKTQAARLDYIDMRGPKIAVGIDKENNLTVVTINGRIRESVGATHVDMAKILEKYNIVKAMGFDPGGSSTLVVNNKTINISPYNEKYEENVYSLPPQPRAVSNAVITYYE
ncbi:MAG: phosphodiester glycosidase family protein, partial [Bacteroidota bacterium]|nr:phosphodiester glycosidase family protein [Bacteroidota bacterium]